MAIFSSNLGAVAALASGPGEDLAATLLLGNTTGGTGIEVTSGDPLLLNANASVPGGTPAPGKGTLWVQTASPSSLIYTDQIGTDHIIAGSGAPDIVGPISSSNNALVRWSGTSGKIVKNSTAVLDDSGNLTITGNVTVTGLVNDANGLVLEGQLSTPGGVPAGTYGTFWVDDTGAPSLPKFTDDAGTTITLGAGGGTGDVVGPGGATGDAVARYNGATGKLIQDSVLLVTGAGAVSGATTYNGVTVETHATRHENGGADELSVAGLNGLLADNQNPVPTAGVDTTAIHNNVAGEIAAIAVKGAPVAGDFLVIEDSAAGNTKKAITLGTLPGGAPAAHAASHENGGSDEISVAGLNGLLADNQNPVPTAGVDTTAIHNNVAGEIAAIANKAAGVAGDFLVIEDSAAANVKKHLLLSGLPPAAPAAHAASHENGGGDEISVLGLSGLLADNQNPVPTAGVDTTAIHDNVAGEIAAIANKAAAVAGDFIVIEDSAAANVKKHILVSALPAVAPAAHAASHENGGGDEISVAGLSGLLADNQNPVPTAGVDTTAIHDNVAGEIAAIANKAAAVAGDFIVIEDSAAANVKKHILVSALPAAAPAAHAASHENGGGDEISVAGLSGLLADNQNPVPTAGVDTTAIHDNVASEISAIANKAVPAAGDFLVIEDSAAANVKKHILISSLPSGSVTNLQTAYVGGNTIVTNSTEGDFDVSGSEAISLDASAASNLTVTGADLTLATLTSGGVLISGADGTTAGPILVSSGDGTGSGNDGADLGLTSGGGSAGSGNAGGDGGNLNGSTGDGGAGDTTFAGGAAGNYQWSGGTGGVGGGTSGAGGPGGGFAYVAGDGGNATAGTSAGGDAGGFSFTAADGGSGSGLAAGGAPGGFTFTTGTSGTGASATSGGDFQFTGAPGASMGGAFFVNTGAATGIGGLGGEITLTGGNNDVTAASGDGGAISATGGSVTEETSTGDGGAIDLISGSARLGTPGAITLQTGTHDADTGASISLLTEGLSGPVRVRTSTGFAGTECEHLTFGSQESLIATTGDNVIVNLGTLDTNGRNMMINVTVTAQDNVTDANFASAQFVQSFYRAGATITALAAHQSSNAQSVGWSSAVSFSIVPSLTSIELHILNVGGSAEVANVAVCWTRQEGGFSS